MQAMFILNFDLIICSINHMHVALCVPHGLHLCQVNCIWTTCRQLCFNLLGYLCGCFKNLIVQIFKSQTRSIPFKMFSFSPPPFPSSFPLTPWTLKQKTNKTESSTCIQVLRVLPVFLLYAVKQGSLLDVISLIYAWIWKIISGFLHGLLWQVGVLYVDHFQHWALN